MQQSEMVALCANSYTFRFVEYETEYISVNIYHLGFLILHRFLEFPFVSNKLLVFCG